MATLTTKKFKAPKHLFLHILFTILKGSQTADNKRVTKAMLIILKNTRTNKNINENNKGQFDTQ